MAEGIAVAGQSQFALATIPKSSRKHNLTVLAMALIVEVSSINIFSTRWLVLTLFAADSPCQYNSPIRRRPGL